MNNVPVTNILNRIKEKTSTAYLYALVAKVNYTINPSVRELDELGVDYAIMNKVVGEGRSVASEAHEIKVQLKSVSVSSSTMIKETDSYIEYRLSSSIEPIGFGNFYIFLICLPESESYETWVELNHDHILIKKCAYYYKVDQRIEAGLIKIPKTNILNENTITTLF